MTTVREATEAPIRPARRLAWIGLVVLVICELWLFAHRQTPGWPMFALAATSFLAAVAGAYYSALALRCAVCKTRWRHYTFVLWPLSLSRRIRFCPFCGVRLDSPVEDAGHTQQASGSP